MQKAHSVTDSGVKSGSPQTLQLVVTRQDALAVFHEADYTGPFFAVCCARGLMKALGRKVKRGETIKITLSVSESI